MTPWYGSAIMLISGEPFNTNTILTILAAGGLSVVSVVLITLYEHINDNC
jgi:hypothetical protein